MHSVPFLGLLLLATLTSSQWQSHYISNGAVYPRPTTGAPSSTAATTGPSVQGADPLENSNRFGEDNQQPTQQSTTTTTTTEVYNNWPSEKLPFHILNQQHIQEHLGLGTKQ